MTSLVALACLVIALALGAFSSLMVVWQYVIGAPTAWIAGSLLTLTILAALWTFRYCSRRALRQPAGFGLSGAAFAAAAAFAVYWMFRHWRAYPYGDWDGWAIWNLHAKFLYRGGANAWKDLFDDSISWTHPDYPLLLPGLVAGIWTLAGRETALAPAILSTLFGLLAIAVITSGALAVTRNSRGWFGGLILLATPNFLLQSAHEMADIPLALYILTTVVALQLAEVWADCRPQLLMMAGFSAGLAAWTKNEGVLFVAVLAVLALAVRGRNLAWRAPAADMLWLGAGLAPMLVIIAVFKLSLSPPNDIMSHVALVERITNPARYLQIAAAFQTQLLHLGEFGIDPLLLVGAYLAVEYSPRKMPADQLRLVLLPVLVGAGYFAVYLISPHDLTWHLDSSLDRLFLQLWPASLFIAVTLPARTDSVPYAAPAGRFSQAPALRRVLLSEVVLLTALIAIAAARNRIASRPASGIAFTSMGLPAEIHLPAGGPVVVGQTRIDVGDSGAFSMTEVIHYAAPTSGVPAGAAAVESEAVIATPAAMKDAILPCRDDTLLRTAITVANSFAAPVEVALTFNELEMKRFTLAPGAGTGGFLSELIPGAAGHSGTCLLHASTPVTAVVLLTTPSGSPFRMTAIPVLDTAHPSPPSQIVPYLLDKDSWSLELMLTNPTSRTVRGIQSWYNGEGRSAITLHYEIPPHTAQWSNREPPDPTSGYVQITPELGSDPPQANLLLIKADRSAASSIVDIAGQGAQAPGFLAGRSSEVKTKFVVVNPGPVVARVQILNAAGPGIDVPSRSLRILEAPELHNISGIAEFESSTPISVTALRYLPGTDQLLSSLPSATAAASLAFFPHFALGSGFTTDFLAYSPRGAAFSGRFVFFDRSGQVIKLTTP